MSEDPIERLRDTLLRRELTPEEERQWTALHDRSSVREESSRVDKALGRAMRGLSPARVPSNFTARVMAEVGRQSADRVRPNVRRRLWERWRGFLPLSALGVVCACGLAAWEFRQARLREAEVNRQRAALRVLADLSPMALQDFEVIRRLGDTPAPVDFELLAALE